MKIYKAKIPPEQSRLAVVVMAVDSDPMALSALKSVHGEGVEKVLVNTGTGSLAGLVDLEDVTLIESPKKRMPGGTRNLGILHSKAPIVSFLAADCLADPASLEERISAHHRGYRLVSSALRPSSSSLIAWACYVYIHHRRMPGEKARAGCLFGASYDRGVFEEAGFFNEEMRISEDAEFNSRCKSMPLLYADNIITYHIYPDTITAAMEDVSRRALRERDFRVRSGVRQARSEAFRSALLHKSG